MNEGLTGGRSLDVQELEEVFEMLMPSTLVIVAECSDCVGTSLVDVTEEQFLDLIVDLDPEECRVEVLRDKRPQRRRIEKAAPAGQPTIPAFKGGWVQVEEEMRSSSGGEELLLMPLWDIMVFPGYRHERSLRLIQDEGRDRLLVPVVRSGREVERKLTDMLLPSASL